MLQEAPLRAAGLPSASSQREGSGLHLGDRIPRREAPGAGFLGGCPPKGLPAKAGPKDPVPHKFPP